MCGRFALGIPRRRVVEALGLVSMPEVPARYNIAPSQLVEAVYADRHVTRRVPGIFRWGLVPAWAKDQKIGAKLINARVETVFDKPAFRAAIRYRRCLIPAQGFYEWQRSSPGRKQPYYITPADGSVLILAGIIEHYAGPGGEVIDSLAILTREASGVVRQLHDRQPLILSPDCLNDWLDPSRVSRRDLGDILDAAAPELSAVPVGTLVNNPRAEGPELIAPIGPPLVGKAPVAASR